MTTLIVQSPNRGAVEVDGSGAICGLIERALLLFDTDQEASRGNLMRASELLRTARAGWTRGEGESHAPVRQGLAAWQVNRLIDYIETHLAEKITGRELASVARLSTGQLFRAFRVSIGTPPFHYIALRRIELACRIMQTTGEPLSQVALASGLCDQAHLCRVFRRITGVTPAVWRRGVETAPDRSDAK